MNYPKDTPTITKDLMDKILNRHPVVQFEDIDEDEEGGGTIDEVDDGEDVNPQDFSNPEDFTDPETYDDYFELIDAFLHGAYMY